MSRAVSARESGDVQAVPPPSRTHDICEIGGAFGAAYDERFSAVVGVAVSWFSAPFTWQGEDNSVVNGGSLVMERTVIADVWCTSGGGVVQGDCDGGRLPIGVGCDTNGQDSQWCLVTADGTTSYKHTGNAIGVFGTQTFST